MIPLSNELLDLISRRLKVGDLAKPVQRVEVDRLVFIPGRTEEIDFITADLTPLKEITQTWLEGEGESTANVSVASFPVMGKDLSAKTSGYGMRNGKLHAGIDIDAPVGQKVVAAWDGEVVQVVHDLYRTGTYITLQHQDNVRTRYFHLSKTYVKRGDQVSKGQIIADVGNTGNVWSRTLGRAPTGSYDDPSSERSQGYGAHLHFEVQVPNKNGVLVNVDPEPYLKGVNVLISSSTNTGDVGVGSSVSGVPGAIRLKEDFNTPTWYQKSHFYVDKEFVTRHSLTQAIPLGMPYKIATLTFNPQTTHVDTMVGLSINVNMVNPGYMDFGYFTDFLDGDELTIWENGKMVRRITKWTKGVGGLKDIYIPQGENHIQINVKWKKKSVKQIFAFTYLQIRELVNEGAQKPKGELDPLSDGGGGTENSIENFLFNEKVERVELQVGKFVYSETLVLDSVQSIEIDDQFEMESREAVITVSNPDGYYSPDFNPYFFPEQYKNSPWTSYVNGFFIGVISTNAPVRIYLGYGQNLVRVFTGLVDRVDMTAQSVMTIYCRDMYKKAMEKVLLEEKAYPKIINPENPDKVMWLKSAVIHDLVAYAGLIGWRAAEDDLHYPDAIIEETYLIEVNQKEGYYVKAVPGKEGEFITEKIDALPTPYGWMNPFVEEYGKSFGAFQYKVNDCINEVIANTNYRAYCDRYGTFRLEQIEMNRPVVAEFDEDENLITLSKTIDFSRARSHLVVWDDEGRYANFVDKELLMELKSEVRTASISVPWAKSYEAKQMVAERAFFDMKRLSRTLQASIIGNPGLEVLDRVVVRDKRTTTRSTYIIKGIRTSFGPTGYIQIVDLMWGVDGTVV